MNILTTLPTDSFVSAAFAELLEDVTNLLSAAQTQKPCDKDEIGFWKRQLNALNKAESYWAQGVRPVLSDAAYLLASASRPGALVHRLTRIGGILLCSCEAGQQGTLCWHHMLVNVLERAAELESAALKEAELVSGNDPETGPNPIPHASEAAAWVGGQITLAQRLAATAQIIAAMRTAQQRMEVAPTQHVAQQARAAQPAYRRPLFADRDAETFRLAALSEERAVLLEQRARRAA